MEMINNKKSFQQLQAFGKKRMPSISFFIKSK